MKSLESRLHLGLGLALLGLMSAFWWLGYDALQDSAKALMVENMDHDAEALIGRLAGATDQKHPLIEGEELAPVYLQPYSGHYYVILGPGGDKSRSRSLWDQDLEVRTLARGEEAEWHATGPEGQRLLVRAHGYLAQGKDYTLALAQNLTPLEADLATFQWRFGLLALLGLLIMTVVRHWIVHRVFQSLNPVYADIEHLEQGRTERLTEDVPAEIQPLVRKLNRLLALLAERLERSRKSAANLAHGIKGPLAGLRQSIQAGDTSTQHLLGLVEQIREHTERELHRARLAGAGPPGRRFDPGEDLPELLRLLERIYLDKPLALDYRIDMPGTLNTDREDMLELLGVLLDNACKWAKNRVTCLILPWREGFLIRVEDDGPGCEEADLAAIRARGSRLDERVSGHGLGLSIASDVLALYGGELVLGRSPGLGGFMAEARIAANPLI